MNKKYKNNIIIISLLIILFEVFDHTNTIKTTIINSSKIWFYNLIPSIFPMYILLDLFINYNVLDTIYFLFKPIKKLLNLTKESSYIFLLSILSGFPSNSKYIYSFLVSKNISLNDANHLLLFTHFSNPIFILESIGGFLNNKKISFFILISHYLGNFIIAFIFQNKSISLESKIKKKEKNSFVTTLTSSIYNTIKVLILLYGIITIFMIITSLIKVNFNLNPFFNSILCGILEMTSGIYYVSFLSIPILYKSIIITFFLSFGGICIHMQVMSILSDYKINYLSYFKARIIHALISCSILFIILKLF